VVSSVQLNPREDNGCNGTKKNCRDEATTLPRFGAATLQGLVDNATALLADEKDAKPLSADRQKFHLKELLGYIAALHDTLERNEDTVPDGMMPMRALKQRAERGRARIWATGLEIFNETGDILLLPQMFAKAQRLFWASLASRIGVPAAFQCASAAETSKKRESVGVCGRCVGESSGAQQWDGPD
jgi:hypothetical protein